jgi:hypothetical protein
MISGAGLDEGKLRTDRQRRAMCGYLPVNAYIRSNSN